MLNRWAIAKSNCQDRPLPKQNCIAKLKAGPSPTSNYWSGLPTDVVKTGALLKRELLPERTQDGIQVPEGPPTEAAKTGSLDVETAAESGQQHSTSRAGHQ